MDIKHIIQEAGRVWDEECKAAFEAGVFDTDRDTFIAEAVTVATGIAAARKPGKMVVTKTQLDNALYDIHHIAKGESEYEFGLPFYHVAALTEMRRAILAALDLECEDDLSD